MAALTDGFNHTKGCLGGRLTAAVGVERRAAAEAATYVCRQRRPPANVRCMFDASAYAVTVVAVRRPARRPVPLTGTRRPP